MTQVPTWIKQIAGRPILWVKRRHLQRLLHATQHTRTIQAQRLRAHLDAIQGSAFAREHGLDGVRHIDDLRRALPVAPYERMASYIEQVKSGHEEALFRPNTKILMFALTSGTTAPAKFIPTTQSSLSEYKASWSSWGCSVAEQHPVVPFAGILNLVSHWCTSVTPSGVPCGSISGLLFEMMYGVLKTTSVLTPAVMRVANADARHYLSLRLALARDDLMMMTTANPSSLVLLAQRLGQWAEPLLRDLFDGTLTGPVEVAGAYPSALRRELSWMLRPSKIIRMRHLETCMRQYGRLMPHQVWPRLELLGVWTGGTLTPYLRQLAYFYSGVSFRDHGLSASEGRMTIPLNDGDDTGLLNICGSFFEFIPAETYEELIGLDRCQTLLAYELEVGRRYYMVVTTSGGLVRYDLADCVECTGFLGEAPLLRFLHKGRQIANITGEKVSAHQVTEAVRAALTSTAMNRISDSTEFFEWTMVPTFEEPRGYVMLLEHSHLAAMAALATGRSNTHCLCLAIDRELIRCNIEYADKRHSGRLVTIRLATVPDGTFARLRDEKLQAANGHLEQYKHPFLIADPDQAGKLLAAATFAKLPYLESTEERIAYAT